MARQDDGREPAVAQPAGPLSARLRGALHAAARGLSRSPRARDPSTVGCSSPVSLGFVLVSFLLAPFLGRNFFPQVDGGQILMHVRAPVGMRIEETAARFGDVEKAIRSIIPPAETGAVVDNIGTYLSSINTIYNNTGTINESDGDIQISLNEGHAPTAAIREPPAQRVAAALSGTHLLVPAGGHRQPDPEFRRTGAHRSAGSRQRSQRGLCLRQQAPLADSPGDRRRRRAHPAIARGCRRSTSTSTARARSTPA